MLSARTRLIPLQTGTYGYEAVIAMESVPCFLINGAGYQFQDARARALPKSFSVDDASCPAQIAAFHGEPELRRRINSHDL